MADENRLRFPSGGEVIDVFEIAGGQRPEISVLTDEFLDDIGAKLTQSELQIALLASCCAAKSAPDLRATTR